MRMRSKEIEFDARIDILRQRTKNSEDLKVQGDVFDTRTLMNLYNLASKGIIDFLGGSVSTGKEASIFYARGDGKDLVLKIYRVSNSNFRVMQDYLLGDPRFGNIKGTKRSIVSAWTKKEFRNLKRAEEAGVCVPHPMAIRDNILVMELIGCMDNPAPPLKEVQLEHQEAIRVFGIIADYIGRLYRQAKLVHADLSEFNILYDGNPIIIDMGQSVTLDHHMARIFLDCDVANIVRYFRNKYGIGSEEEVRFRLKSDEKGKKAMRRNLNGY